MSGARVDKLLQAAMARRERERLALAESGEPDLAAAPRCLGCNKVLIEDATSLHCTACGTLRGQAKESGAVSFVEARRAQLERAAQKLEAAKPQPPSTESETQEQTMPKNERATCQRPGCGRLLRRINTKGVCSNPKTCLAATASRETEEKPVPKPAKVRPPAEHTASTSSTQRVMEAVGAIVGELLDLTAEERRRVLAAVNLVVADEVEP